VQRNGASNGLLAGAAARLLFDAHQANADTTATVLGLALAQPTDYATAWIEGFLRGSGLLLIHHRELFGLLNTWLGSLGEDTFRETGPLLHPGLHQLFATRAAAAAGAGRARCRRRNGQRRGPEF